MIAARRFVRLRPPSVRSPPCSMKSVLITGASGFVGRHCVAALTERGFQVHAVSRHDREGDAEQVQWHQADLLQPDSGDRLAREIRPTHLLHLAWTTEPTRFLDAPENLDWVEASIRLVRQFCQAGGRRVVVAGSSDEYDASLGFCSETRTPLCPNSHFASCKHALHQLLASYAGQVRLSVGWARLFALYGPFADRRSFPMRVIGELLEGQVARCSLGNQIRDYLHVADAAEALAMLVDSDLTGAVNVASGVPVQVKSLTEKIGRMLDREKLIHLGALRCHPDEPPLVLADVRRLTQQLGFTPRFGLTDGLRHTIQWCRNHAASLYRKAS